MGLCAIVLNSSSVVVVRKSDAVSMFFSFGLCCVDDVFRMCRCQWLKLFGDCIRVMTC